MMGEGNPHQGRYSTLLVTLVSRYPPGSNAAPLQAAMDCRTYPRGYVVKDTTGQSLAYVYEGAHDGRGSSRSEQHRQAAYAATQSTAPI